MLINMILSLRICHDCCPPNIDVSRCQDPPVDLPAPGDYVTGMLFVDPETKDKAEGLFEEMATKYGLKVGGGGSSKR